MATDTTDDDVLEWVYLGPNPDHETGGELQTCGNNAKVVDDYYGPGVVLGWIDTNHGKKLRVKDDKTGRVNERCGNHVRLWTGGAQDNDEGCNMDGETVNADNAGATDKVDADVEQGGGEDAGAELTLQKVVCRKFCQVISSSKFVYYFRNRICQPLSLLFWLPCAVCLACAV